MGKAQYKLWQHTDLTIDVVAGRELAFLRDTRGQKDLLSDLRFVSDKEVSKLTAAWWYELQLITLKILTINIRWLL